MLNLKQIEREQNAALVDQYAIWQRIKTPRQGWIRTLRIALGLTGAMLSKRLGLHRSAVSYLERAEQNEGITLKKLREVAIAMDCELVYALVPKKTGDQPPLLVNDIITQRAEIMAKKIVQQASVQMALEAQQLDPDIEQREIQRLAKQLQEEMPKQLWED